MKKFFLFTFLISFSPLAFSGEFKFDVELNTCVDSNGNPGLNSYDRASLDLQCTDFRDHALVYVRLENLDLRGSVLGNNNTYGGACSFRLSDLRYSVFFALGKGHGYKLDEADLRDADLSEVELTFTYDGTNKTSIIVTLNGATFNRGTKLPKFKGKYITATEAVSKFGMLYVE